MADTSAANSVELKPAEISADTHVYGADIDLRRIRKSVLSALIQAATDSGARDRGN